MRKQRASEIHARVRGANALRLLAQTGADVPLASKRLSETISSRNQRQNHDGFRRVILAVFLRHCVARGLEDAAANRGDDCREENKGGGVVFDVTVEIRHAFRKPGITNCPKIPIITRETERNDSTRKPAKMICEELRPT